MLLYNSNFYYLFKILALTTFSQGEKLFFHFTRPLHRYFSDFGCPDIKSTYPKKMAWAPRCHEENLWMTKCQYSEKGCYFCHKLRDAFGKLHRRCLFFSFLNSTRGNVEICSGGRGEISAWLTGLKFQPGLKFPM